MSKSIVFIQVHGRPGILESEVPSATTAGEIHDTLAKLGVALDADTYIFIEDDEQHLPDERHHQLKVKHGCRVHITRCHRIKVTVHYLERTTEREFSPGARVRAVKEWAVSKFTLSPKDAAEHVLQLCNSTVRPSSDTPLHELAPVCAGRDEPRHGDDHHYCCAVCLDLVPDKRVEG